MGPLCGNSMCNGSSVAFVQSILLILKPEHYGCALERGNCPLCPESDRRHCNSSLRTVMSFPLLKMDAIPLVQVETERSSRLPLSLCGLEPGQAVSGDPRQVPSWHCQSMQGFTPNAPTTGKHDLCCQGDRNVTQPGTAGRCSDSHFSSQSSNAL